ncbi:unnamed protein product [Microthlaspi erraticum]|uniref:COPA/B second beta-propeller domain-containing protein n=1 Tax=Microthlaspi erraticum TaxID=1685480 RepID=A0A6D2HUE9_9BRAS|nr:unnamed protein product [Microthlaspi erraticum]
MTRSIVVSKCERKSESRTVINTEKKRVYGLSFHYKRPWILASLDCGEIQLWDYHKECLIRRFGEHQGPVYGVDLHKSTNLFVSGGDDRKIMVWDCYKSQSLFTLQGHGDIIRTVQFHHEYPWIVSASDDKTVRIWNWQSRNCICVLTGHNSYVKSASFHPTKYLVLSASMDCTVRIWDIGGLRKKTLSPADALPRSSQMFSGDDAIVKHLLQGHAAGVNSASFHPTLPLIVSGSDDNQLKLWEMDETRAWEIKTLQGHTNNVSSVIFHAKQDIIVSNSEDKSIRVWDDIEQTANLTSRQEMKLRSYPPGHPLNLQAARFGSGMITSSRTFQEEEKFWSLAAHPETNLLAAGHDSGIIIFTAKRVRPAFVVSNDFLIYAKGHELRRYEFSNQSDSHIMRLPSGARTLSYSPEKDALLISTNPDGQYELRKLSEPTSPPLYPGNYQSAVFVTPNRFAALEDSRKVLLIDLHNKIRSNFSLLVRADAVFYAGTGYLLCRSEHQLLKIDINGAFVAALKIPSGSVRHVVWSRDMESVALLSKHSIRVATKMLVSQCFIEETILVDSAAFDEIGVLLYTTLSHIKYCLPNGDIGTIQPLEVPMYITKVCGDRVFLLDQDGRNGVVTIDQSEEASVKLHSIWRVKGSDSSRLSPVAAESATELLAYESLRKGNILSAEVSYKQTRNFERLSFLYSATGNLPKLSELMKTAEAKSNLSFQLQSALFLGDVEERIRILEKTGNLTLAYTTASVHGLVDVAERLANVLGELPTLPIGKAAPSLLMPPRPVMCGGNWPMIAALGQGEEVMGDEESLGQDEEVMRAEESNVARVST